MLVNRGWVPPNWKAEWQQHFMKQQPQGLVAVSGTVQGSESPSSYVPQNKPEEGLFFWVDVPGLVSSVGWLNVVQQPYVQEAPWLQAAAAGVTSAMSQPCTPTGSDLLARQSCS